MCFFNGSTGLSGQSTASRSGLRSALTAFKNMSGAPLRVEPKGAMKVSSDGGPWLALVHVPAVYRLCVFWVSWFKVSGFRAVAVYGFAGFCQHSKSSEVVGVFEDQDE